jgi:NADPH:quinone reductase-like Zn-dependent oxidoreductase
MGRRDQGRKERFAATAPPHAGSDLSGDIVAVGPGVSDLRVGDQIYGVTNPQFVGAYAEYALASAAMISRKPASLTYVEAASVPVIAVTAWQALFDQAHIKAGQTVVIHGAAGNVGAYAVQLAHRAGVRTIGTSGTDDISVVRELGANTVIDFQTQRFEDEIRDADVVIDLVGGETQVRSFQVLRRGGKLISSVSRPDQHLAQRHGVEARVLSGQRHKEASGGDRSPGRWWTAENTSGRGSASRRCARGSSHVGTLTASAERKDRAYRRSKLSD